MRSLPPATNAIGVLADHRLNAFGLPKLLVNQTNQPAVVLVPHILGSLVLIVALASSFQTAKVAADQEISKL